MCTTENTSAQTTVMTRDEATSALGELAYEFANFMLRRGIKELPADEWLVEFRSWLPSGRSFAEAHVDRIKWLEEMERGGR